MSVVPTPALLELERRLDAAAAERLDSVTADLPARIWDADRAPAGYLPLLAWALSADGWWTEAQEIDLRLSVRGAVQAHRAKGTSAGVTGYLDTFGVPYLYEERPAGAPFTASISLEGGAGTPANIQGSVDRIKRASVHITWRRTGATTAPLRVATGADAATVATLSLTY